MFKLITLIGPDDFRHGYPVSFCITNEEGEQSIKYFLQLVADKCPNTSPNIIMTDDDLSYRKAATWVFPNIKHFLCVWHIHRSW